MDAARIVGVMLPRVIVAAIPVLIALVGSAMTFARERTGLALVQLAGAVCLLVVIFAHISEALGILPSMGWGRPNTVGHYVDLTSAITGIVLLAVGYFWRRLLRRKTSN